MVTEEHTDTEMQAYYLGTIHTSEPVLATDYSRGMPSGVREAIDGGDLTNFGRALSMANAMDEAVRRGLVTRDNDYDGLAVVESWSLAPGKLLLLPDPPMIVVGIGLKHGVPYLSYLCDIEYGYLVGELGEHVTILEARTGRLIVVPCMHLDEAVWCDEKSWKAHARDSKCVNPRTWR